MSTIWLKNFFGLKQSDFELLKVPNPRLEYGLQVTMRTAEVGTLLGSLIGPVLAYIWADESPSDARMKQAFTHGGLAGALIGAAIGPIISFYTLRNMSTIRLYDRCYRRRFDLAELNFDRACFLGSTLGYIGCGAYGYVVGVDAGIILSNIFMKNWKKNF